MLRQNLQYLHYIARHKWYVFLACLELCLDWVRECDRLSWTYGVKIVRLIWRGLAHDISKFYPSEWGPYRAYFYGVAGEKNRAANLEGKPDETGYRPFDLAWLKHQHRNPHHWQYYILRKDDGSVVPLLMSELDMLEMLCDWKGAGASTSGRFSWARTQEWYQKNSHKQILHPSTKARVEAFLRNASEKECS